MNTFSRLSIPLRTFLFIPFVLALSGCGGPIMLFDQDTVKTLAGPDDPGHHILCFQKSFEYTADGKLFEKTHQVIRLGQNAFARRQFIEMYEDSVERIINIEARVIHKSGSVETFTRKDFSSYNLSDDEIIAEQYVKFAKVENKFAPGDLIEMASNYEHALPQLGIRFSFHEIKFAAENISCSIALPSSDSLQWRMLDSDVRSERRDSANVQHQAFRWRSFTPPSRQQHSMESLDRAPLLLAAPMPQSWKTFGDWYFRMAEPKLHAGKDLEDTARTITSGKLTPKEKMDAIFQYCQRNVRYEQVFVAKGEFIPNDVNMIFSRRYGDCKDYASLMYAMAKSVGLDPQLALCYRGRGKRFFDDIPVSQFNHILLHFADHGRDYWYDGTNRVGLPGITTFDLANARALVIEETGSRLCTIEESPANSVILRGSFLPDTNAGLRGTLRVVFTGQFAIDLFWIQYQTNHDRTAEALRKLLYQTLNEDIIVDSLSWDAGREEFSISVSCRIPNAVARVMQRSYLSIARMFPRLLPDDKEETPPQDIYFFPHYNSVDLDLSITTEGRVLPFRLQYHLPPGPFSSSDRSAFLDQLASANLVFQQVHSLGGDLPQ